MALILAILIAVILFTRVQVDKTELKKVQKESADRREKEEQERTIFFNTYVDRRLEDKYRKDIIQSTPLSLRAKEQIENEVGIPAKREMILLVMLAEHCKVPYEYASFGIGTPNRNHYSETFTEYCDYCQKYLEFLIWYNKKLMSYGMEHELVYVRSDKHPDYWRYPERHYKLHEVKEPNYHGIYLWMPTRSIAMTGKVLI